MLIISGMLPANRACKLKLILSTEKQEMQSCSNKSFTPPTYVEFLFILVDLVIGLIGKFLIHHLIPRRCKYFPHKNIICKDGQEELH